MGDCLNEWKKYVQLRQQKRVRNTIGKDHYFVTRVTKSLAIWTEACKDRKQENRKMIRAREFWRLGALFQSLFSWRKHIIVEKRFRVLKSQRDMQQHRLLWNRWIEAYRLAVTSRALHSTVSGLHDTYLMRHAFRMWISGAVESYQQKKKQILASEFCRLSTLHRFIGSKNKPNSMCHFYHLVLHFL